MHSPNLATSLAEPGAVRSSSSLGSAHFRLHDTPVSLVVGQAVVVNLEIQNTGVSEWLPGGRAAVHIGYQWFDHAGRQMVEVEDRRTALPQLVAPNDVIRLGVVLATPRQPGMYQLNWNLVQAGGNWFDAPLSVPVKVTAAPSNVTGWRVESNCNPAQVVHAIDGEMFTTWDSELPQAPGQWFRLNLGMPRMVDGVQFLSPGKNFPSGYLLRASPDGRTWHQLARVASGNSHDVVAVFAPQKIQYVQIDLLTRTETNWQIADVLVHSAATWTANASHNASHAALAIDNRDDTEWSCRSAQAPAMWFQIDLGRIEMVSGVALDAPLENAPAGFCITTWNASASRWQVAYEKLRNTTSVEVSFAATPTQFINIQLLAQADRPWIIRHARVEREMETWLGPSQI